MPARVNLTTPSYQERRVIERLWLGETHKEIAVALALSPATVRNYLSRCYVKFQVANKTALLHHALNKGWIRL